MLTVVFSTWNGGSILPAVLESYMRLERPEGGWKLVAADNGSTDDSRSILDSFAGRLPLETVYAPQSGKNAALNAALERVEGDLVVLTDDDVFPRPDWLQRLRAGADAHRECTIFGGRIVPRWETEPPEWLLRCAPPGPTFALTAPSLSSGPIGADTVFGPNMAIRASIFAAGIRFSTSIGPCGRNYAMGSETELVRRLLAEGHGAWHVADAVVEHFIRTAQTNLGWILARAIRFGRGQYRLSAATLSATIPRWRGVPRYLYRQLASRAGATLLAACQFDRDALFRERWQLNYTRGQMLEARILHRESSTADD